MTKTTTFAGAAATRASPQAVWNVLADPQRIPAWFRGARDVDASATFPQVGSRVTWSMSRWRFEATVLESRAPGLLRQSVKTPSATSIITHRIRGTQAGSVYEKEVEARWNGWLGRLLGTRIIRRSVRAEARRVAALAETEASRPTSPRCAR